MVTAGTSIAKNVGTAVQYLSGFTSSDAETDCLKPVESGVYIKKDGIYLIVIRFALSGCANNNLTYGHRQYISTNDYVDSFDYDYCDHSESFNRTQVRAMRLKAGYYLRPLIGGSVAVGRCTAASMSVISIKSEK